MKLLAIDGNSIVNRAFYGIKLLTTKDGKYTNAIVGFLNILSRLCDMENPDGVAVAWDLRAPTFRHKMYGEYKAGRKPMPEELHSQLTVIKDIIGYIGYVNVECEGYEADDILGTLANMCETSGNECVIATGDRDSLQLVSDKTKILLSATKMGRPEITEYNLDTLFEKYGVTPDGMIEIKALQGDSSDNIPGVAGIGEKTAGELIKKFGTIDTIYENLDSPDIRPAIRNKLIAGKESAYNSKILGTIVKNAPICEDINLYKKNKGNLKKLASLLYEYELIRIADKFGIKPSDADFGDNGNVSAVTLSLSDKLNDWKNLKSVDLHFDSNSNTVILCNEGKAWRISGNDVAAILSDENIKKRAYDTKTLYKYCLKNNIKPSGIVFDIMLAAYLLNPSASDYSPDRLCREYHITIDNTNDELVQAAEISALCDNLEKKMSGQNLMPLLTDIELPLAYVLAKMETVGFSLDTDGIKNYGAELERKIELIRSEIINEVGYDFNLNSPKQLGKALFEDLGIPCKKKTKSGYSTNAQVLESLQYDYPIVSDILNYRTLTKLKSTYCDGLCSAVCGDGRIRSTLNQTETRTGRISSSEPNLQNIPVRKPEGKELRKFFKAKPGFVLCDADYSQIELRVLASIADDDVMIKAFEDGVDIHTVTASQVFNMPIGMVTPLMRSRAKAVNFGIVYGIGAFSLSKDIGVTRKEADEYIKKYLATYHKVADYMQNVVAEAKKNGYVTTIFGRKRFLPELANSNKMIQSFGERVARNMPIQGTAADIIKIAMIKVVNRLEKELPDAHLIMQVHDELIVEAPENKAETACKILKEEMENAVELSVPLSVDVSYGETWYDAKK